MRQPGVPNKKTAKTLQTFAFYVAKYKTDPLELLFMAMAGHKKLFGSLKDPAVGQTRTSQADLLAIRLTAAKELMPYGYAKLAALPTEKPVDPDIRISWQGDLFENDQEAIEA